AEHKRIIAVDALQFCGSKHYLIGQSLFCSAEFAQQNIVVNSPQQPVRVKINAVAKSNRGQCYQLLRIIFPSRKIQPEQIGWLYSDKLIFFQTKNIFPERINYKCIFK